MFVLHIGTFEIDKLDDVKASFPSENQWFIDGDSWEVWGEGGPENEPHHIMIRHEDTTALLTDLATIMAEHPTFLVPMAYYHQRGTLACITPFEDWSEPVYCIEETPSRRFLANLDEINENIWNDPAWIEYLYLRMGDKS